MIFELLLAFLAVLWIKMKWKRRHLQKLANQLNSNLRPLPFIGHSYLLAGNDEQRMKGFQTMGTAAIETGGTTSFWHSNNLYIMIADPEVAEIVLKSCLEKDDITVIFQTMTGDGSIFTNVAKWRPRRKFLAPTFNTKNLNRFVEVFSKESSYMVDKLKSAVGKGPCSMWTVLSTYTMDAVCGTTLGIQVNAQKKTDNPFLVALDQIFEAAATVICRPWLQFDFIFKRLPLYHAVVKNRALIYGFIDKIITEKSNKRNGHQHSENSVTFLELMLDSVDKEDNTAVREECFVILGAGTDTTAVGMGYVILMLASHPEIQEKVYQELLEIFGGSDRAVQADDIHRLKYLDAVVKETLRLYPPVPIIARKITKDVLLPSGVTLLKGCGSMINIWAVHRNPMYWGKDANEFRPERFLDSSLKHPVAFMPFSNGPRNCLGYQYAMMSMKTALATLVRQYRLLPTSDVREPLRVKYDIMMRHVDDYCVHIEARK